MPFCTLLSRVETVSRYCAWAALTSPLARASRRLRRLVRTRLRLARLTSVRVTVWRARFRDDTWFAIDIPYLCQRDMRSRMQARPHPSHLISLWELRLAVNPPAGCRIQPGAPSLTSPECRSRFPDDEASVALTCSNVSATYPDCACSAFGRGFSVPARRCAIGKA